MPAAGGFGVLMAAKGGLSTVGEGVLLNFLQKMEGQGVEPIATRAEIIIKVPDQTNIQGELLREKIASSPKLAGSAVFKDDKLVGWLDEKETRGFNWITGKVKGGILTVDKPEDSEKKISLEITRAKGKFVSSVKEGRVLVAAKINTEVNVGDVQGPWDPTINPDSFKSIEDRMAKEIEKEVRAAVTKAQLLNSDIFGFGADLYRRNPQAWLQIKNQWDQEFAQVEVEVKVKATIRRTGNNIRSIKISP
jgi:spore germination protein KC